MWRVICFWPCDAAVRHAGGTRRHMRPRESQHRSSALMRCMVSRAVLVVRFQPERLSEGGAGVWATPCAAGRCAWPPAAPRVGACGARGPAHPGRERSRQQPGREESRLQYSTSGERGGSALCQNSVIHRAVRVTDHRTVSFKITAAPRSGAARAVRGWAGRSRAVRGAVVKLFLTEKL